MHTFANEDYNGKLLRHLAGRWIQHTHQKNCGNMFLVWLQLVWGTQLAQESQGRVTWRHFLWLPWDVVTSCCLPLGLMMMRTKKNGVWPSNSKLICLHPSIPVELGRAHGGTARSTKNVVASMLEMGVRAIRVGREDCTGVNPLCYTKGFFPTACFV